MQQPLHHLSISGFKSIRSLNGLALDKLNLLVGANGSGKSNFISFFRMVRAMAEEGLASFVTEQGGADGFFFNGPKATPAIEADLRFAEGAYQLLLTPTAAMQLMVKRESLRHGATEAWTHHHTGAIESQLKRWGRAAATGGNHPGAEWLYRTIANWRVYHFHDTSITAGMRRDHPLRNWRELQPDAANLAPFLLHLQHEYPKQLAQIRETVQLIAPFFDDFLLEPVAQGENEMVRLEWRQRGSAYPFQPWQLSDGTIRFIALTTALLQPHPPSMVVIDEPELGLHPFALDLLAGVLRDAAERTQLIVSTQSASLLNHFAPTEVIVVDRAAGCSRFRRLDGDSLAEWLNAFALGELWQKNVLDGGPVNE